MTRKRIGVLPYVRSKGQPRLVLVTSMTNRNWIFPKGRSHRRMSNRKAALREAYEEAGLRGSLDRATRFRVEIEREGRLFDLTLYAMEVETMLKSWPEDSSRRRIIVSPTKAEKLIDCGGMRQALRRWRKTLGKRA